MPMRHSRVDVEFYINSSSGEKPGPDYELRGHQYTDGLWSHELGLAPLVREHKLTRKPRPNFWDISKFRVCAGDVASNLDWEVTVSRKRKTEYAWVHKSPEKINVKSCIERQVTWVLRINTEDLAKCRPLVSWIRDISWKWWG